MLLLECHYYKRVSHARAAFMLTGALLCAAWPAARAADTAPAVWPVDSAWASDFPFGGEFALVLGQSRLFVVEPAQVAAHAWRDGAPLWKIGLNATARPVADEGRVFIAADDQIHALSEVSGHVEWRLPTGRVSIAPAARAGWLIVAADSGTMRGVSTSSGRVIWEQALPAALTVPPVIDGDLIVGASADGRISGWNIIDGSLRWTRDVGTRPAQLLAASGQVFVAGTDGRLFSLRYRDGRHNWSYPFGMAVVGRLAADSRHVYATTIDNSVRAHTFNGHQHWRQPLAARVVDGLLADAGTVFVPQSNGEIRMYLAERGTKSGRVVASPTDAVVLGGLVAAGSGNDLRMAITTSAASRLTVTAYRRTGLGATGAISGPPGTPLGLSRPGGRP